MLEITRSALKRIVQRSLLMASDAEDRDQLGSALLLYANTVKEVALGTWCIRTPHWEKPCGCIVGGYRLTQDQIPQPQVGSYAYLVGNQFEGELRAYLRATDQLQLPDGWPTGRVKVVDG